MNPEQWLSLKWNGGSTMSDRWLNQSKIIHVDRTNFRKAYARIRRFCFSYVLSLLKGLSFGRRCHTGNIYESYEKIKRLF